MKVYRIGGEEPDLTNKPGVYSVRKQRGRLVVSAWPRKRNRIAPGQLDAVLAFKRAVWMCRNAPAEDMAIAMEMAKGSPFTWRDVLMMSYYGRLYTARTRDGMLIAPRRVVMDTIQELLAAIGDVRGMILFRGVDNWYALLPGEDTEVLTTHGANADPTWEAVATPPPGEGSNLGNRLPYHPVSTSFAWKASTQGNASIVDNSNFGFTIRANSATGHNLRLFGRAVPAGTLWSIITGFRLTTLPRTDIFHAGLYLRDTVGLRIITVSLTSDGTAVALRVDRWTSPTSTPATTFLSYATSFATATLVWLRIRFDNTNYYFDFSNDGLFWVQLASIGKTAWLAAVANECGLYINPNNAGAIFEAMTIFDYQHV